MPPAVFRLLLPILLLLSGTIGWSQGERSRESGRVVLYAEADFKGDMLVLYPGDRIEDLAAETFANGALINDRISSIRIDGAVRLMAYMDGRLKGDVLELTESHSNLADLAGPSRRRNWNDCISSLVVEHARLAPTVRRPGGSGRGEMPGPRIELYSEANYRGARLTLAVGDRVRNLADVGFEDGSEANDRISSIRVHGGTAAVAYSDGEFQGESLIIEESLPNLALVTGLPGGRSWNDVISSLIVSHQRSVVDPEGVIARAYQELLGRPPDAEMLAHYARAMRQQGYTETELRNELRRSREYREREADLVVAKAYRAVLRREPDAEGLAHYRKQVLERGWSESDVRAALRQSDEYRKR